MGNILKAYLGETWKKIAFFFAVPIVWLISGAVGGPFRAIMTIVMLGVYYVVMGMGIYDDIRDDLLSSGLGVMVQKYQNKTNKERA